MLGNFLRLIRRDDQTPPSVTQAAWKVSGMEPPAASLAAARVA
jgi:hypothetical protein